MLTFEMFNCHFLISTCYDTCQDDKVTVDQIKLECSVSPEPTWDTLIEWYNIIGIHNFHNEMIEILYYQINSHININKQ